METYLLHCSWVLYLVLLTYYFEATRFISFEIMEFGSNSHVGKQPKVKLNEHVI